MISPNKFEINTSFNELDDYHPTTPISNMPFDESMEFRNSDYISSECMEISDETIEVLEEVSQMKKEDKDVYDEVFYPPSPPTLEEKYLDKIGNGKFEYINDYYDRVMLSNAWQAITQTNNWDFVSGKTYSFMWSNDPRIDDIMEKMEELGYSGHSGCSFGCTMRNMHFIAQNGEEEFKKLFEKPKKD